MVPFESKKWLLVVFPNGSGVVGKFENNIDNWILLKPARRIGSLMNKEVENILSNKRVPGSYTTENDMWVEPSGCEIHVLEKDPWESE